MQLTPPRPAESDLPPPKPKKKTNVESYDMTINNPPHASPTSENYNLEDLDSEMSTDDEEAPKKAVRSLIPLFSLFALL